MRFIEKKQCERTCLRCGVKVAIAQTLSQGKFHRIRKNFQKIVDSVIGPRYIG